MKWNRRPAGRLFRSEEGPPYLPKMFLSMYFRSSLPNLA